jgi:hypothetical protein
VELKTLTLLRPRPVHKEAELMMHHCDRYEHVAKDSKGRKTGEQAEDETQSLEEFRGNGQKCNLAGVCNMQVKRPRAAEPVSTELSEHLLGAVGEKYNPHRQSKSSYGVRISNDRFSFLCRAREYWIFTCPPPRTILGL